MSIYDLCFTLLLCYTDDLVLDDIDVFEDREGPDKGSDYGSSSEVPALVEFGDVPLSENEGS